MKAKKKAQLIDEVITAAYAKERQQVRDKKLLDELDAILVDKEIGEGERFLKRELSFHAPSLYEKVKDLKGIPLLEILKVREYKKELAKLKKEPAGKRIFLAMRQIYISYLMQQEARSEKDRENYLHLVLKGNSLKSKSAVLYYMGERLVHLLKGSLEQVPKRALEQSSLSAEELAVFLAKELQDQMKQEIDHAMEQLASGATPYQMGLEVAPEEMGQISKQVAHYTTKLDKPSLIKMIEEARL
jgi:hypothetical protein